LKNAKGTLYKELPDMAKLYSLVTGEAITAEELKVAGERINTLAKLINTREGLGRKDDTLPWKVMNQPITDDGPAKGAVVTQEDLTSCTTTTIKHVDGTLKAYPQNQFKR
jgi:aldehyde:ferredoxin oxidoreductase